MFFIVIVAISLVICLISFYPLLKKDAQKESKLRDQLNKAFYFDRLKETEQEAEQGKIDDLEQTRQELQQNLLDDIPIQTQAVTSTQKFAYKTWFVALLLIVPLVSTAIYWQVGSKFDDSMLSASHQKLSYFYERIKTEDTNPLSLEELNQFAMALRVELQKKPQDHAAWFTLGQIGMATNNGQLALDSFAKASQIQPENQHYRLRYVEILMYSDDPQDKAKGEEILKALIRADHTNIEALSLLAFRAFEQEDYKMAAVTWGMMLKLMPEDDPRRTTVERSMQSARSMLQHSPTIK
ncbi:cytochrome c-type biogenesis protein CcmI [Nicoletella semolina]|uniref:Cytochrome c-type biogenesis protein CcmI n=2 Tax=Nicoletella semolina TaxID=271160 RepID=A0A4R2N563_9PAST|nr:cytochrome c-type biogenesis protein CcmI [Nicoletella semolina]